VIDIPVPAVSVQPAYRIDGTAVDAGAFYAAACDPRGSVVVEACAGAGKTWMLVSRIVRALLDGVEPSQILAITFTRKAAGEMRERLDDWLQDWADPSRDAEVLEQALRERGLDAATAAAAVPDLRRLQRRLLAVGRGVEIRTFHGWFAQLLSFAPLQVCEQYGLPPTLQFIEDPAPLRAALMRRFHQRLLADAAARADHQALVQRHRRSTVTMWLDAVWARSAELMAADAAGVLEASVPPASVFFAEAGGVGDPAELIRLAPIGPRLVALSRALRAKGGKTCLNAADALDAALSESDASAALEAAYAALHTKEGPRKHLAGVDGFEEACERLVRLRDAVAQQRGHDDHHRMVRLARLLPLLLQK
jgi:ATP-dependent helicase/nuclease subunit A